MADPETKLPESKKDEPTKSTPKGAVTPLIFISHDTRDASLAEAVSKLLSSVSCGMLKSFRSSDKKGSQGIEYGLEWYPKLMNTLNDSSGVLCLLTERSMNRPWILYEAGVAKGKLDTPVYGVAFGITLSKANSGPFAQFQNCDDDEESLTNLIMQLLDRIPNSEPDREAVSSQVRSFIEKKNAILAELGEVADDDSGSPDSSAAKLFEEVKLIIQDLPSKVENRIAEAVDSPRRRKMRRFHPRMFDEFLMMSDESDSPVGILMVFSMVRDDAPWLYELGREFYEAVRGGNRRKIEKSHHELRQVLKMTMHHPIMEEMMMGSKSDHMFMMEMPRMIDRYMDRYMQMSLRQRGLADNEEKS